MLDADLAAAFDKIDHSRLLQALGSFPARDLIEGWLKAGAPRGLSFNEDKTKVVRLTEGFDFLGASVRRYPGGKLLIKPSKAAIRRLRERLAAETRTSRRERAGGHRQALPDYQGMGGLLPDGGAG
jgi:hypothetical protein